MNFSASNLSPIVNPLLPSLAYMGRSANFFFFNLRMDHQKKKNKINPMSVATMSR